MTRHSKKDFDAPPTLRDSKARGRPTTVQSITAQILHFLPDFKHTDMPLREAQFAIEYATNGFDGAEAYRRFYDKRLAGKTAEMRAQVLLRKDNVRNAVAQVITAWINERKIRLEQEVVKSLYAQAFYDPALFVNPDGSPAFKQWDEIPAEWRCCVEGIEQKRTASGKTWYTVIKLVDRRWALDRLSRLIALAEEGLQDRNTPNGSIEPKSPRISEDARARLSKMFNFQNLREAPGV